jgi:hypothetical protein
MTANFSNFHVIAPAGKPWISIEPASNVSDPLGHEWSNRTELGLQDLKPGASVQWKIRLELFAPTAGMGEMPPA